jgi:DNA-binding MarR family transcriptional regulator
MKGDLEKCFKRMIDLIEDHNLIIKNHSFYDMGDRKVIVQLKDLSENILAKRQKELLLFLNGMISLPSNEDKDAVSILD